MSTARKQGSLYTQRTGALARIEFGHPASNSFTSDLLGRLEKELDRASDDPEVAAILLQSEGDRAFCAGASFDELLEIGTEEEGAVFFSGFARVINAMRRCRKPIVARVHGKVVGGGVGLVAACDYAFASEAASVRLSEISLGIAPLVIAPAVARKAGVAGLAELSLSPDQWKSAYWALEKGLYARVFETRKELDEESEFFAAKLASYSPAALSALKNALWEGTGHWQELLARRAAETGKLALSETTQATLRKFKEKK
ncbi:enoyl-CoA hydratase/isomerase family protein [Robiginitalea sp. SC105]|uniref:enoyl-CoA hydratase/isomerase family protein n=1 Tax=Robiginitalea sp. SC105 TaxID=2762332 RepID=UPI00163A8FA3|nr:enoyl-CoA hydratase/isomerase family protein [Robiginitalea sp. SC105]MBC2838079.1 enoyl-CoA hydratase/isomerase family protein [Robiginitalea sp. SC105]